jgi:rhodanese-related sulfurtransferase
MIFKKLIPAILLGFLLCFGFLVSIGQNPILAATLTENKPIFPEKIQTSTEKPLNLESGVAHFLKSMPSGYYTIANVEGLKSQLKNPKTLLVDVREVSEYKSGHIPNAVNIPLRTLTDNLDKIPRDRSVILYCSSGYRSAMGVMTLHLLGYDNIQGFPASFVGWKASGEAIALQK